MLRCKSAARRPVEESVGRAGVGLSEGTGAGHNEAVYARGTAEHFARHLADAETRTLTDAFERVRAAAADSRPSPAALAGW
jgi:hypothetical protein